MDVTYLWPPWLSGSYHPRYGVYYCSRAFIPLLKRAEEGALVNTSSQGC